MIQLHRDEIIALIDFMYWANSDYGHQVSNQLGKWGFDYNTNAQYLEIINDMGDDQLRILLTLKVNQ